MTRIDFDFALARYDGDGSLDTTFGVGGKMTTAIGSSTDMARSVAIQPDGKIVIAGVAEIVIGCCLTDADFSVARYDAAGSLDATFGTGGTVTTDFDGWDEGSSVAIRSDGKIVVAGGSHDAVKPKHHVALARYLV